MRRSIGGPVVVIAIGALFLLNNFRPDIFTWRALGQFWPFLLIGFGIIRLLEVLSDAARARPLQGSFMSGGGIVLFVLACLLLWSVSKTTRGRWHGPPFIHVNSMDMFGEEFDFDVKQDLPVTTGDARLVLDGLRGNITVAGDDSSSVAVSGHKSIHAFSHNSADEASHRTQLEIVRNGNDIVVRSTGLGSTGHSEIRVAYDIDIKVPRRMSLATQGATENVTVESLDGNVDVSGDSGNIILTSIGGNARVETSRRKDLVRAVGVKGTLDLRGTGTDLQIEDVTGPVSIQGTYFGTLDFRNLAKPLHFESEQTDLRVEKLPGSISMDLSDFRANNVTGPLHLRCQSRDVHISDSSNELEVIVDRGDIEINPQRTPLAKIDVRVKAGDIDLTLPGKSPFDLHAHTVQGDVDNQFGDGISSTEEGRSASLKSDASVGPAVTVTTDRGRITVKKS